MRKLPVVPFCRMTSGLQKQPNQTHHPRRPASARGAFRPIVTKREAGCDGRGTSTDEGRCARTAKACGPGAPWLALSLRTGDVGPLGPDAPRSQATGDYEVTDTGESTHNAVNTIAQGRPGRSG
jgi:hypothetical protein